MALNDAQLLKIHVYTRQKKKADQISPQETVSVRAWSQRKHVNEEYGLLKRLVTITVYETEVSILQNQTSRNVVRIVTVLIQVAPIRNVWQAWMSQQKNIVYIRAIVLRQRIAYSQPIPTNVVKSDNICAKMETGIS